jgi:hypothetical protein
MIALSFHNIDRLKQTHFAALKSYVSDIMSPNDCNSFYSAVISLPGFEKYAKAYDAKNDTFDWLEKFILADYKTLELWAKSSAPLLKFDFMKKVYLNRFSKGIDKYVDKQRTYNSYTLFRMMDINVCPYCEHEFFEEVVINGQKRRTAEFDHFFPKGDNEYPGLAMCFYNLIPSCKPCNQLKMTNQIAASPYDPDIESLSHFWTDLPIGINMNSVTDAQCEPKLDATEGMAINNKTLAIEQRYKHLAPDVHRLLINKQSFDDAKLLEIERLGICTFDELKIALFGNPRSVAFGKELHTKMKEDLIDY